MEKIKSNKKIFLLVGSIVFCCTASFLGIGFNAYKINLEIQNRSNQEANQILGFWQGIEVENMAIEIQEDGRKSHCYIGIQASEKDISNYKGEIILEFCYQFDNKQYLGRHLWGGGKSETTSWGQDGGVTIELRDNDTMFMRFLDSIYSDGWTLKRED